MINWDGMNRTNPGSSISSGPCRVLVRACFDLVVGMAAAGVGHDAPKTLPQPISIAPPHMNRSSAPSLGWGRGRATSQARKKGRPDHASGARRHRSSRGEVRGCEGVQLGFGLVGRPLAAERPRPARPIDPKQPQRVVGVRIRPLVGLDRGRGSQQTIPVLRRGAVSNCWRGRVALALGCLPLAGGPENVSSSDLLIYPCLPGRGAGDGGVVIYALNWTISVAGLSCQITGLLCLLDAVRSG